jgi:hypothetical protein
MQHPVRAVLLLSALVLSGVIHAQEAASEGTEPNAATAETTAEISSAPQSPTADAAAADASASTTAAESAVETAAAPVAVGMIGPPPAGKGQIVFFREKKFAGSAVRYKVREGDNELGKLSSGVYFVHTAEPGAHEYTVHSEAKDVLNLEVEEGETYYVIGSITMGILAGRPNLSPSDADTFNAMSAKLKLAQ